MTLTWRFLDGVQFRFSPSFTCVEMTDALYSRVYDFLILINPNIALHTHNVPPPSKNSLTLSNEAYFFDYIILNRRRYYASNKARSNTESLVALHARDRIWVGELKNIFKLKQPGVSGDIQCFGDVYWFRPCESRDIPNSWSALYVS
jgi:hypothetical protein